MPTPFNIIFKIERNKKAYSRFVNAFPRISKNYDFRFQIFCHIDLVLPFFFFFFVFFFFFFFFFRCGGRRRLGDVICYLSNYNVLSRKREIQRQKCSYNAMIIKWSEAQQNQQMTCAPSEDSDTPNLARVLAVRLTEVNVISYPYSAQRRLWSDWADAQTALSLRWSHMSFCLFCRAQAQM